MPHYLNSASLSRIYSCYVSMRGIAVAMLLLHGGSAFADESPTERITAYFAAFNSNSGMEEVGAEYWFSEMVLNPRQRNAIHLSRSALAQQFERLRSGLKDSGWIRSEVDEIGHCQLREDFALVSVRYIRIFENGARRPGAALYTLGKDSSVWKISSINSIDDTKMIRCNVDDS
ncbi:MAG: hypothetical protein ACI9SX_001450 [Pseudoalteromonas tetraodonis]|jgi:hypothetical protein